MSKIALVKSKKTKQSKYLSTGSYLLDLALTGRKRGGFKKGTGVLLVGASSTGKTWFSMTCFAEAVLNPAFSEYKFRFNNAENGMMIDVAKYFGQQVKERMTETSSGSLEDFYYDLDNTLDEGPCIYITDSMDALHTKDDESKFQEEKSASKTGKKVTGTYGMSKAKKNKQNLARLQSKLKKTGSILIIIAQTIANVGFSAMFNPDTRSGGKSLKFFAHVELWTSIIKTLKKSVHGKDRKIGALVKVDVQKNRLSGWEGNIEIPFIKRYGLDDIGSCIDFLIDEKEWKDGDSINTGEFQGKVKRSVLIKSIESNIKLKRKLYAQVKKTWEEVEEKSSPKRRPKYV